MRKLLSILGLIVFAFGASQAAEEALKKDPANNTLTEPLVADSVGTIKGAGLRPQGLYDPVGDDWAIEIDDGDLTFGAILSVGMDAQAKSAWRTGLTSAQESAWRTAIGADNASNLTTGTVPNGRFPATLPAASGANLTNLPASALTGVVSSSAGGAGSVLGVLRSNGTGTVTAAPSGWGGDYLTAPALGFTIPVPPGAGWTDFELKCVDTLTGDLLFYFHSPDPTLNATPPAETYQSTFALLVYYTRSAPASGPSRQLWQLDLNDTIGVGPKLNVNEEVGGFVVLINVTSINHAAARTAINASQGYFVYRLFDDLGGEVDGGGREIWRPILPVIHRATINQVPLD